MEKKSWKESVAARVDKDVLAKVRQMAKEEDRSVSHMIEILLKRAVMDK